MPTLYIIRGLPGSGKSTLASMIAKATSAEVCEADQFFMVDGEYRFDRTKLPEAHQSCKERVFEAMAEKLNVVVANTFVRKADMDDYLRFALYYGYEVQTVVCQGQWESIHGVPKEVMARMRASFEV